MSNAKPGPIFSAESITATLNRRKILTTRVIDLAKFKGIEVNDIFMDMGVRMPPFTTPSDCPAVRGRWIEDGQHWVWHFKLPYEVGKVYYVREAFIRHASIPQMCGYEANGAKATEHWERRVSARHMPKWAARVFIEITSIRIGRLHQMGIQDLIEEGMRGCDSDCFTQWVKHWDSINKKRGFPWSSNPWRVSYGYKMVERPVSI